ncbi:hypothetical protein HS088_TW19G00884 [Tripterygium wilfordii]|uniref:Uncharacterized protein n=1 Tax=Tripterygium wilfordii TaxID=458696 RepID=A0A7J7CBN4_TRIWF|nr:uncharacterized protein LOC119985918 [Tripterygium wilfordii]KAF5731277.1 hypothetical protein HS088_TW19G00884 [Tripterygium wilfordii]
MALASLTIKTFLLVLLLVIPFYSGMSEGFKDGMNQNHHSLYKDEVGFEINSRKLLMLDAMLDYDDAGPNPKHDPRRKPGTGGAGRP